MLCLSSTGCCQHQIDEAVFAELAEGVAECCAVHATSEAHLQRAMYAGKLSNTSLLSHMTVKLMTKYVMLGVAACCDVQAASSNRPVVPDRADLWGLASFQAG